MAEANDHRAGPNPLDFTSLRLSPKPNQFLVLPSDFAAAAKPHARSPVLAISPRGLERAWLSLAEAEPRVRLVERHEALRQVRFLARSARFGFPDDIWVQITAIGDRRATFAAYSRSRYGCYDFGANRKRMESWVRRLRDRLGETEGR